MFRTIVDSTLVTQRAIGAITLDTVATAIGTWFDDPRFDATLPVLWDVRDQKILISPHDLTHWPAHLREKSDRRRARLKSAILVNDFAGELAARRLVDTSPWMIKWAVFRSHAEALRWLTESE